MLGGSNNRKELARLLAYSQIGMEMVSPIVLGLVVDFYFKWSPWGVVVGVILGLVGGLAHLIQLTSQEDDSQTPPPSQPSEGK